MDSTTTAGNWPDLVCVDNGHFGETGYQPRHTSLGTDLAVMAAGAGISSTRTVESEDQIPDAARLLREGNGTCLVVVRVKPTDAPACKRLLQPAAARLRFRQALPGTA